MTIDPYHLCICGSGKKIKFCCSKDITAELEKVISAIQGNQRVAALDQIDALISTVGRRDCLSVIKINVLMQVGEYEAARKELKEFLVSNPMNPIARCQDASLEAAEGNIDQAVQRLQDALEVSPDEIAPTMVETMAVIGSALFSAGRVCAARNHVNVYNNLTEGKDEGMVRLSMETVHNPNIPIFLRQDQYLQPCPEDVEWKDDFAEAILLANRIRWRAAIRRFEDIDEVHPSQPCVLKNIAILLNRLGEPEEMADAWREFSEIENLDLSEAVEAEALAQLVDPSPAKVTLKVVECKFNVNSVEDFQQRMSESKEVAEFDLDPSTEFDGPPPKVAYHLLDRPLPDTWEGLDANTVPEVQTEFYLFGKQMDQEARIELLLTKDENANQIVERLQSIAGDSLGEKFAEEDLTETPVVSYRLMWQWRWPDGTPAEFRNEATAEKRRQVLLNVWPDTPLDVLDGKTPREAVKDLETHIKILAAIMLLEESTDVRNTSMMDMNDLRESLELPKVDTIVLGDRNIAELSPIQMCAVEFDKLDDKQLVHAFNVIGPMSYPKATIPLLREIITRDQLDGEIQMERAYQLLARFEANNDIAFEYINQARNIAVNKGESAGVWLARELEVRFERGITERCDEIVRTIESRYLNDPTVGNELMRVLTRFGMIDPNGRPGGAPGGAPGSAPGGAPAGQASPVGVGAEPNAGEVWSPEASEPEAEGGEKESKLWLPGMD